MKYPVDFDPDRLFDAIVKYVHQTTYDKLVADLKKTILSIPDKAVYEGFYNYFPDFWGTLDCKNEDFTLLMNRAETLKEHIGDIENLYNDLQDVTSKRVLSGIIQHWLTFDSSILEAIREPHYLDYWDKDIVFCDENEVIVDLGAFLGESIIDYINTYEKLSLFIIQSV